jgi:hypothetical protein
MLHSCFALSPHHYFPLIYCAILRATLSTKYLPWSPYSLGSKKSILSPLDLSRQMFAPGDHREVKIGERGHLVALSIVTGSVVF